MIETSNFHFTCCVLTLVYCSLLLLFAEGWVFTWAIINVVVMLWLVLAGLYERAPLWLSTPLRRRPWRR